jgi:hypothetical protein
MRAHRYRYKWGHATDSTLVNTHRNWEVRTYVKSDTPRFLLCALDRSGNLERISYFRILLLIKIKSDKFEVLDEVNRQYRLFNAQGTQLKIRLLSPADDINTEHITHFQSSVNAMLERALRNVDACDMVGLIIHSENSENVQITKPTGFSFRLKYQLTTEVIWRLFEEEAQSNATFNALDPLTVTMQSLTCM